MDIRKIYDDNISDYSDLVDGDIAENMGRMNYRGIAGYDSETNDLLSMLIWELKTVGDSTETESELKWIYAVDSSFLSPMLEDYHNEAQSDDVSRTFFESSSLGKAAKAELGKCGFSLDFDESRDIFVTVEECKKLPITKKSTPPYIQSIANLDNQEFYQGLMNVLFKYEDPSQEDLAYLPKEWYEQSVSCYTKTDGKVTGLLLLHACPSGLLIPVLYYAVGADYKLNLIGMLRFSINRAAELYPGDTVIRIHRRNSEVKALSSKLFPGKKGEEITVGERSEK